MEGEAGRAARKAEAAARRRRRYSIGATAEKAEVCGSKERPGGSWRAA